ncbi:hypothetical protein P4476_07655 [Ureibacillus terrenus]|uniref:hypothetical protein n=1 Tax=Ureibacillus terrenus TaxID=118246 RepID=UPI002E1ACEAF|nr:hypothetical protein [Ureibacillus terrenus]
MNDYEKQYFNTLLQMATERFVERALQRSEGAENALRLLRTNPHGEGIWLDQFVDVFFEEFLLNNPEGSCFILQALAKRKYHFQNIPGHESTVEEIVEKMAKEVFENLLKQKAEEVLEQQLAFGG